LVLHTELHPVNPALIKVGFTYGVAPRKPRLYKKVISYMGLHPVWGFTGACPRDTFHGPVNAE